ncbi:MAG: beta-ketoacyl synthase chain length factor [Proteobacteria bacterium]|nr:beta-ketoacyl synthase chain length factor [Pseudomonadota bacterium]MCL2309146.1 beta-ketoacyl synthase chain length factor [Pseudomonadota bacterium]
MAWPEFSFRRWSAWAPAMTDAETWQAWAREGTSLVASEETAPVKAMPPLLRRRAQPLGRAALEVLYAPTLAYADQPIVFCSRQGEIGRAAALLQELAAKGQASPQEFSMSVHNAIPGLFLIAQRCRASAIVLASENQLMFSGIVEALAQLTEGAPSVILLFCDAPLPALFRSFCITEPACFAFALEMTKGKDYRLAHTGAAPSTVTAPAPEPVSALPLLRFVLDETQGVLPLTGAADWQLLRLESEVGHA